MASEAIHVASGQVCAAESLTCQIPKSNCSSKIHCVGSRFWSMGVVAVWTKEFMALGLLADL